MESLENKTYKELNTMLDERHEEYERIEDKCAKEGKTWDEARDCLREVANEIHVINQEMRLKQEPQITFGRQWKGDTMTLNAFKRCVNNGSFVDYDGYGYYATKDGKSDILIYPSDVEEGKVRTDFTHVVWFNR